MKNKNAIILFKIGKLQSIVARTFNLFAFLYYTFTFYIIVKKGIF